MRFLKIACASLLGAFPMIADACDTALVLTIDVSNSIDTGEYRLQTDGLADALRDLVTRRMSSGESSLRVVFSTGALDHVMAALEARMSGARR